MAKKTTYYVCQNCGDSFTRWSGKCLSCGEWNSLSEFKQSKAASKASELETSVLKTIDSSERTQRISTGIAQVDTVLGGGIVRGSVSLIAGQPGIGKSTLLLQIATALSAGSKVLYVSGEESAGQIKLRGDRLKLSNTTLNVATTNSTDDIAASLRKNDYDVVIIDSIQTIGLDAVPSAPGSTSQITQSTHVLIQAAKASNTSLVIVGHVTKEGNIAGPKLLEHLVDVVLSLEGDRFGGFKMLRGVKNRYGSTDEIGIFEMRSSGLIPIDNPSAALLDERRVTDGSVVTATMEGSQPLLVEVQALVNPSPFGYPKRAAVGISLNRLNLLIAVLSRRTKLQLADKDVYVTIIGGIKVDEPAADLAICMAIASASKQMIVKFDAVVFGEVGLSGEIRHVPSISNRIKEAKKLGFKQVIGPKQTKKIAGYNSVTDLKQALNGFLKK